MSQNQNNIEKLVKIAELSIKAELEAIDRILEGVDESAVGKIVGLIEAKSRMKSYAVAQYIAAHYTPKKQDADE